MLQATLQDFKRSRERSLLELRQKTERRFYGSDVWVSPSSQNPLSVEESLVHRLTDLLSAVRDTDRHGNENNVSLQNTCDAILFTQRENLSLVNPCF